MEFGFGNCPINQLIRLGIKMAKLMIKMANKIGVLRLNMIKMVKMAIYRSLAILIPSGLIRGIR